MTPVNFNQSNTTFGAPKGLEESQCATVPAYVGTVERGSCEGAQIIVVAWLPGPAEREAIAQGMPVFLSCLGGLPPHFITTNFEEANNPA